MIIIGGCEKTIKGKGLLLYLHGRIPLSAGKGGSDRCQDRPGLACGT